MKTVRLGLVLLFLASFARGETKNELEIKSYSPEDGIVEIKTGAGITKRPFSSFGTEERGQIIDWLADKEFKSSGLRVKIETRKTTKETTTGNREGEVDHIFYVIELENRTTAPFKDVEISCRIFYEIQDGKKEEKRCVSETFPLDLLPGQTQTLKTQSVSIRDEILQTPGINTPFGGNSGGRPTVYYKDRLKGLYVRVSKPDRTGANVILEFEDGRLPDEDERADYQERPKERQEFKFAPDLSAIEKIRAEAGTSQEMVLVEGGTFVMGPSGLGDIPARQVTLNFFEMGACEITAKEIARVLNWALENNRIKIDYSGTRAIGVVSSHSPEGRTLIDLRRASSLIRCAKEPQAFEPRSFARDYAISDMSWYGAAAYCNFRSEMEGLTPCYDIKKDEWTCDFEANGYRLPTEAEWEYAARGGRFGRGALYSGGDDLDQVGKYDDKISETQFQKKGLLVAERLPNELGLFDMSGNAAEWCFDWYGEYEIGAQTNPAGSKVPQRERGLFRVQRGGHWRSPAEDCRVTARAKGHPEKDVAGFRVVRRADYPFR